jgi:hypothetical protein
LAAAGVGVSKAACQIAAVDSIPASPFIAGLDAVEREYAHLPWGNKFDRARLGSSS